MTVLLAVFPRLTRLHVKQHVASQLLLFSENGNLYRVVANVVRWRGRFNVTAFTLRNFRDRSSPLWREGDVRKYSSQRAKSSSQRSRLRSQLSKEMWWWLLIFRFTRNLGGWSGMSDSGTSFVGCRLLVARKRQRQFVSVILCLVFLGSVDVTAPAARFRQATIRWLASPKGELRSRPVRIQRRVLFSSSYRRRGRPSSSAQCRRSPIAARQLDSDCSTSLCGCSIVHDGLSRFRRQWYYYR